MSASVRRILLLLATVVVLAAAHEGHDMGTMASSVASSAAAAAATAASSMGMNMPGMTMGSSSSSSAALAAATSTSAPAAAASPAPADPLANTVAKDKLTSYCASAPKASAPCSLYAVCQSSASSPANICGTTAIAGAICATDKLAAGALCDEYAATCTGDKCKALGWPGFATSAGFQAGIFGMCGVHSMIGVRQVQFADGRDQARHGDTTDPAKLAVCDSFATYGMMCSDMPKMKDCAMWRSMCGAIPSAGDAFPTWCAKDAMAAANVTYSPKASSATTTSAGSATATDKSAAATATATGGAAVAAFVVPNSVAGAVVVGFVAAVMGL
ncbi:hypothetical protein AMAG_05880 [Allomyces macrogynus ATCC 38327]|uniref:Extracellular membrane protein CFEM domain-containing protein n=1 Tax=Allomyces macrogynus (strain ATCC 38327) TaxID=578462 RepID=A0A0L0SDE8_ALLM3|nr:hypothetical protein AMAG_05880 [Allomyces macrogynus ATCC 38327]|eukprot:KNE60496.1 hypothetical protein AMAG_05880 [Allomyces macrogynus ATCC 38327]